MRPRLQKRLLTLSCRTRPPRCHIPSRSPILLNTTNRSTLACLQHLRHLAAGLGSNSSPDGARLKWLESQLAHDNVAPQAHSPISLCCELPSLASAAQSPAFGVPGDRRSFLYAAETRTRLPLPGLPCSGHLQGNCCLLMQLYPRVVINSAWKLPCFGRHAGAPIWYDKVRSARCAFRSATCTRCLSCCAPNVGSSHLRASPGHFFRGVTNLADLYSPAVGVVQPSCPFQEFALLTTTTFEGLHPQIGLLTNYNGDNPAP